MLRLGSVLVLFLAIGCGPGFGERPTEADVEQALRSTWEKPGDQFSPRTSVEFHSTTLGASDVANEQDVVDGIPRGGLVTAVLVDWTYRTYYTDVTYARRRLTVAKAYKDKFGQWAVMIDSHRSDVTTEEPPKP